ncbi:hypothetical protein FGSG_04129 [Fusarium graminearum PH-1]|uniref:Chromosome 2, complete genome n=1 Tax=Gibberella zeae (strain ATCC MYA-4620 / CBS 123657 / FGSC 9075 / NRRL 31084 / PH-1) TaxID=229533 RepID=I1RJU7_GIBZE|nr:hypothetical protein FGSG_04129 [Fusarium graminearum PH-1]ESU09008.1 hypothetical protein FGSG_04129 [Fusarium graminearum PH-1]EYB32380.1 hypothetical protein FG05_04129 [Fusarium graminearum]CAF3511535.1 unnamed protein product [Fusarium graminearum]CEF79081.1 unnamed protein product [Fusarium graminearum]|eukprot:XP_011321507.1 hypothetical protein FGSG_04129 [Fusarium graminearum PH-1]
MAPSTEKRHLRWPTKTKRGFAGTVPDWTIAEDDDDKYDVHIMKRRSARHKVRRDTAKTSAQESELYVSMFEEYPTATATATATQPYSTVSSTPTAIKYESESGSGSDSSDDESGSDDENEESDDEKESDPEPTGKTESVSDQDLEVKLPATATDSPSVQAPSAEGSTDGSMISGGDGIHSNVHKILLGVGSVGAFLLLLGVGFLVWKFYSKKNTSKKPPPVDDMSFEKPNRFEGLVSKIPFVGSRLGHKDWYTIEDPSPPYSSQVGDEKIRHFSSTQSPSPAYAPSSLPSPFEIPSSIPKQSNTHLAVPAKPWGAYRMSGRTEQTNYDIDAVSPTSTSFVENAVEVQVVARQVPREGLSPPYKPQHNRFPSNAPYAYGASRRQTGVSELSSISSGFGDGDIVVTPDYQTIQSVPTMPTPSRQPTWKTSTNTFSRRDTVSTVASVEGRPRFRSVNSWVKQQNGQLRRAQRQQEQSDAPPVPALAPPPEQDFRYMLPDDERPRPVEMV